MTETAQIDLLPAAQVARETAVQQAANGICYAAFSDIKTPGSELQQILNAVPHAVAVALTHRAYYFVPLTIHEHEDGAAAEDVHTSGETLIASGYTAELSDRAICHRNVHFAGADCVFISTRLMQDKFALAFEFFINVGHHFVDTTGVPREFGDLVWSQAVAEVRGETSHDAWENRARALGNARPEQATADRPRRMRSAEERPREPVPAREAADEKGKLAYVQAAFSDALAIYMLSLTLDFDYMDLREREYPLLAAPALAERLRAVAALFPPNPGYEFHILYRRR